jgi:hypothetical protein
MPALLNAPSKKSFGQVDVLRQLAELGMKHRQIHRRWNVRGAGAEKPGPPLRAIALSRP